VTSSKKIDSHFTLPFFYTAAVKNRRASQKNVVLNPP
jgi:hypothetical protein